MKEYSGMHKYIASYPPPPPLAIIFNFCFVFKVALRVFAVEQFGILCWKAKGKTNLTMVSKLKLDICSPRNCELCLNKSKS